MDTTRRISVLKCLCLSLQVAAAMDYGTLRCISPREGERTFNNVTSNYYVKYLSVICKFIRRRFGTFSPGLYLPSVDRRLEFSKRGYWGLNARSACAYRNGLRPGDGQEPVQGGSRQIIYIRNNSGSPRRTAQGLQESAQPTSGDATPNTALTSLLTITYRFEMLHSTRGPISAPCDPIPGPLSFATSRTVLFEWRIARRKQPRGDIDPCNCKSTNNARVN